MTSIALVGCSKSKLSHPAKARNLYTGTLFEASLAYAERSRHLYGHVYIVSAEHYLLELDELVAPYELVLTDLTHAARRSWGRWVLSRLAEMHRGDATPVVLDVLAGKHYAEPIAQALEEDGTLPWVVREPLAGLGLGHRVQQLRRWTEELR